ncbi:MAG TPA: RNA polymerase sigma-70 factor [Longimicrobiaceae bacterium]
MVDHPSGPLPGTDGIHPADGGVPSPGPSADQALAAAIRGGDEASFETLFRTYSRRLYLFAEGYVKSAEVAEDIVADVFVRIWERRSELELRSTWQSYLYTATRNRALSHLEHLRVMHRVHAAAEDDRPPGLGTPTPAADAEVQVRELEEAVERAIALLPERTREAFVLHRKHGLSYAEVALTMGIAPRTVEVLIRRALKTLRSRLVGFLPVIIVALL